MPNNIDIMAKRHLNVPQFQPFLQWLKSLTLNNPLPKPQPLKSIQGPLPASGR